MGTIKRINKSFKIAVKPLERVFKKSSLKHYQLIHYRFKAFNRYLLASVYFASEQMFQYLSPAFAIKFFDQTKLIYEDLVTNYQNDDVLINYTKQIIELINPNSIQLYNELAENFYHYLAFINANAKLSELTCSDPLYFEQACYRNKEFVDCIKNLKSNYGINVDFLINLLIMQTN